MTIETMIRLFDLIQDKTNSAYFLDSEKLDFLNRAQLIFISEYTENHFNGGLGANERGFISGRGLENTLGSTDILDPLTVGNMRDINLTGDPIQTDENGMIPVSDIETAITLNSGQSTGLFKILAIGRISGSNTYPIKYVRHNDYLRFINNEFLTPTNEEPIWTNNGETFTVFPKQITNLEVSVIRYPVEMVYVSEGNASNVDCELSDEVHDRVLDTALNLAGISTRDVDLIRLQDVLHRQDRR